jgi:hypothetical protein
VSVAPSFGWPARWPRYRMRRILTEAASAVLGVVLLVWSLLPVYNMLLIALDPEGDNEFAGYIWPPDPSLESFWVVVTQGYWYLENFWSQFGNSSAGLAPLRMRADIHADLTERVGKAGVVGHQAAGRALFASIEHSRYLVARRERDKLIAMRIHERIGGNGHCAITVLRQS